MRDQFIPVRRSEIKSALLADPRLDPRQRERLRQLWRLVEALFHYEHFEELEQLRDGYHYFNPEPGTRAAAEPAVLEAAYHELVVALFDVLKRANFTEVPKSEVERAFREKAMISAEVSTPLEDYRDIRFFRRGRHMEEIEVRYFFGFRRRRVPVEVNDHVVLLASLKPAPPPGAIAEKKRRRGRRKLRPGSVLIKYFRDIASADLNTLLPEVRVVMNIRDKMFLGVPALFGGIPILIKLIPTIAVILVLLGIRLGIAGEAEDDHIKQALAVTSGIVALGGFVMHQWMKYQRQSLKYQVEIHDNLYFRNINNNAGIFDYLIGAAEDQEVKETLLAYFFLLTAGRRVSEPELDAMVEAWLKDRFGLVCDFEVDDGLRKLERLELLVADGPLLSVVPLEEALRRIDRRWDAFFSAEGDAACEGAAA
jgi:hypothetical protein